PGYQGPGPGGERPRQRPPRHPQAVRTGHRACRPDTLHEVYSTLLDDPRLKLSDADRDSLRARGFDPDEAESHGYRTMPPRNRDAVAHDLSKRFGADKLLTVPGFFRPERGGISIACLPGLLIPCRDARGRIVGLNVRPHKKLGGVRE